MFGLLHSVKIFVFLKSIGLGTLLGAVYLLNAGVRYLIPHRAAAVFLEDICFFVLCAVLTFLFLFQYNAGVPRGYVFFGEGIGFLIAATVLRSVMLAFLRTLAKRARGRG